jgi:hypothetical protein
MTQIKKLIKIEAKIGDEIKAPNSIFRDDLILYICHIDGDLLYINTEKNTSKDECETVFVEDCYLV